MKVDAYHSPGERIQRSRYSQIRQTSFRMGGDEVTSLRHDKDTSGCFERAQRVKQALQSTAQQFMWNTTVHGFKHLVDSDRHWLEKILWLIVQILATYAVVSTILDVYMEYLVTPTVTTVETSIHPVWKVPFPAVAICNINKISKWKAQMLALKLSKKTSQYTEDELFDLLRYVGRMYDLQFQDYDKLTTLHEVMSPYNMVDILKELSPGCEELLVRCKWRGRRLPCDSLFHVVNTLYGVCCAFNLVSPDLKDATPKTLSSAGYKMGLSVVLNPQSEDYYYPIIPTFGVQVLTFNSHNLPDTPSDILEHLVPIGAELFQTLVPLSHYAVPDLRSVRPAKRGCIFREETSCGALYNYGKCLARCHMESFLNTCSCLPFYYHSPGLGRACNLEDLHCLRNNIETPMRTQDDSTAMCEGCLPSCSESWYETQSSSSKINMPLYYKSRLVEGMNLTQNHSILHIFYSTIGTTLYKQDILYSWYELISNFGGICCLFNGLTFFGIVELLYFFTLRLFYTFKEEAPKPKTTVVMVKPTTPYWNEFPQRF